MEQLIVLLACLLNLVHNNVRKKQGKTFFTKKTSKETRLTTTHPAAVFSPPRIQAHRPEH